MKKPKLKQFFTAAAAGTQLTVSVFAADGVANGTNGPVTVDIPPALTADNLILGLNFV